MTVAFDLDDTLYKEQCFVASGRRAVARDIAARHGLDPATLTAVMDASANAFDGLLMHLAGVGAADGESIQRILEVYRSHIPDISLPHQSAEVLDSLSRSGCSLALVTDGRSLTQRHKIEALGLKRWFAPEAIIISEETGADKHTPVPFVMVEKLFEGRGPFVYVGDNPAKDFHHPNLMKWITVMVDGHGENVHTQEPPADTAYRATHIIDSIAALPPLLAGLQTQSN